MAPHRRHLPAQFVNPGQLPTLNSHRGDPGQTECKGKVRLMATSLLSCCFSLFSSFFLLLVLTFHVVFLLLLLLLLLFLPTPRSRAFFTRTPQWKSGVYVHFVHWARAFVHVEAGVVLVLTLDCFGTYFTHAQT